MLQQFTGASHTASPLPPPPLDLVLQFFIRPHKRVIWSVQARFLHLEECCAVTSLCCRYVRSLAPNIHPPRWGVSLALNRFLDQDTYLLATQQSITLSNELRDLAEQSSQQQPHKASQTPPADAQIEDSQQTAAESCDQGQEGAAAAAPMARRSWYCHRSPTDNILVASGKWMDKAVPFMPNRYQGLLTSGLQGDLLSFQVQLGLAGWR